MLELITFVQLVVIRGISGNKHVSLPLISDGINERLEYSIVECIHAPINSIINENYMR